MDVGGWELRDDLDVDLVVGLGILRVARRDRGKGSWKNELNSATAPIAWSQESDNQTEARAGQRKNSDHFEKKNRETSRKNAKLSSLEAKLDSTSSLRLDKDPR